MHEILTGETAAGDEGWFALRWQSGQKKPASIGSSPALPWKTAVSAGPYPTAYPSVPMHVSPNETGPDDVCCHK